MRRLPLNALESFVSVAERRGFTSAARELGVSPSALSQAVRALEERLGTSLLVRTTRSVNLTEAGARLLRRLRPVLHEAERALDEAVGASQVVQGTLRITLGHVALPLVIEPLLGALLAVHPELALEVSVDDRFVDIVSAGFDAGVRLSEAIEPDLVAVRLTPPFRLLVAGAPSYLNARGRPRRPRDLLKHDCIGYRMSATGNLYAWEFERNGREESVAVRGRVITNDGAFMVTAALQGLGLVYVNEQQIQPHLASGALELVLESYAPRVPGFFLYFPKHARRQPKLRAFIDTARRVLGPAPSASEPAARRR